ncbi:MAG: MauE/DoxX family redox-associated membrane protein [Ramlibacter sp.]
MFGRAALVIVFLWSSIGGAAHFVYTDAQMRIVPPWIPWPRAAVLASGVLELLGAAGLLWRPTRRAAAWGLFALTIAVTPANVYMLEQASAFWSVPYGALLLRLPLHLCCSHGSGRWPGGLDRPSRKPQTAAVW